MLGYPGFAAVDLIGPQEVLAGLPNVTVNLIAKTSDVVTSGSNVSILPDRTFDQCATRYDVLMIPGSACTHHVVEDAVTLSFVRRIADGDRYVTSVCTGSPILGAAGLLTGYRTASHWAFREFLPAFGAIPEGSRIVFDRNRITGCGVTAGIDFGLQLAAAISGEQNAKTRQLNMEYDPDPPFDCGTPQRADADTRAAATQQLAASVTVMHGATG